MRSWRSRAAYRIAFLNFGAWALGLAVLGLIVFEVMHLAFTRQLDSMVSDEAQTLADVYRFGGKGELAEAIAERETSVSPTRMLYAVFDRGGRRTNGSFAGPMPAAGAHAVAFRDIREGADRARAAVIDLSPSERLVVAADTDWIEQVEKTILLIFAGGFVGASLLGFAGALILGSYLERRLRSISASAEAIIGGDIRQRMPISGRHDEFDELALTLNRMLDRIEALLDNLRQVSSDVAHDLRTPLARLRNRLEGAVPANLDDVLGDATRRVDEILSLFAAILRIAEVESGETRRFFAPVDLSALVNEIGETLTPSVEDGGRTLLCACEPNLVVAGDRELLAQAVINLLENAQRHTAPGTAIRLTLESSGGLARLSVIDDGPGVPPEDLQRITRRFARLDGSRNTAGYGLGLSLVTAVAQLHHGRLVLADAAPGLAATLELPLGDDR